MACDGNGNAIGNAQTLTGGQLLRVTYKNRGYYKYVILCGEYQPEYNQVVAGIICSKKWEGKYLTGRITGIKFSKMWIIYIIQYIVSVLQGASLH